MNTLEFNKLTDELGDLIHFMTSNEWPYHSGVSTKEQVTNAFDKGWYGNGRETFWIELEQQKVGLLIIHDIEDSIPLFDLRLCESVRGKGIGTKSLVWLKDYIFNLPDKKIRIEAYTRSDNIGMRKTFAKTGFVKEGYLRQAWENDDGTLSDSLCYAVIRSDWEKGIVTPIKLNELPF
ncbi:GNAT family protein [Solibacillus sp. CAU 1738]|uniref:GNAT family N-acetyltransferase n=1 Tax=Solibacillus sp. CAU 1738 TaxID=3140363 RepID=UPI0032610FEA